MYLKIVCYKYGGNYFVINSLNIINESYRVDKSNWSNKNGISSEISII